MKSTVIVMTFCVIAITIKVKSLQGLECYVCDDCNEYEDLKKLQMCGELPDITTLMPTNAPETVAMNPTTTLTVPVTTQKPIGSSNGDDYFYDYGMISNGVEAAPNSTQQGHPSVTEVAVAGTTLPTTINQLGNGNATIIESSLQPVLASNLPTMMTTGNITTNVGTNGVNVNPNNIASSVATTMPTGNNPISVVPSAINGSPTNIQSTLQTMLTGNVPVMMPTEINPNNIVPTAVNGSSTNIGSTLQPVLTGSAVTMMPTGNNPINVVPTAVNGNPTNIQSTLQPMLTGNVPVIVPTENNPNNGNQLNIGSTVQQPALGGNVPTMTPSGNIITNSVTATVNGNAINNRSTLQPVLPGNVAANTGSPGNVALPSSVPSAVPAFSPVQQSIDYDYMDYEDSNAGGVHRLSRAAAKGRQTNANGPVCYMFRYHANNTVYTKRGCTNSINGNSYLTCQSLYYGLPMSGCHICNTHGCNKHDPDESGEDVVYSTGTLIKLSLFLIPVVPTLALIVL